MGPLLVPGDVPDFVPTKAVNHDYQLDEKNVPTTGGIPVPVAERKEEWVWLQPYYLQQDVEPQKRVGRSIIFWMFRRKCR